MIFNKIYAYLKDNFNSDDAVGLVVVLYIGVLVLFLFLTLNAVVFGLSLASFRFFFNQLP